MSTPFARLSLFLVSCCGWAILFFGGWIAARGLFLYARDPVLMGTGGGLAVGGLLVIALALGANAQISTARDTAALRALMEKGAAGPKVPPPTTATPASRGAATGLRAEPKLAPRD
ncbi:MAG: hypothetical protein WBA67_02685 [Jannaschia sp.]